MPASRAVAWLWVQVLRPGAEAGAAREQRKRAAGREPGPGVPIDGSRERSCHDLSAIEAAMSRVQLQMAAVAAERSGRGQRSSSYFHLLGPALRAFMPHVVVE